jgi:hypothetical protein
MAQKNSDGTVTVRTAGMLAYTPRAASSIGRAYIKPGAPGGLTGNARADRRYQPKKGQTVAGTSAYH